MRQHFAIDYIRFTEHLPGYWGIQEEDSEGVRHLRVTQG